MANSTLDLVSLDFSSLKSGFIEYLKTQPQFKDYDFTGSNLNVLLDLLSYNTYKNAFMINMAMSESFLDSAQLKSSVTSHAKELNYTPRSRKSSKAKIKVDFTATGENQPYLIRKGSSFTSLVKNTTYIFTIPEDLIVASANTSFSLETDIYEGRYITDTYIFNSTEENTRYRITNKNVDLDSLSVSIFEDGSSIPLIYNRETSLLNRTCNCKIFFVQVGQDDYYEILFGDDIIGRKPKNGSVVSIDYRLSNAESPNGARIFSINFDPTVGSNNSGELTLTPSITTIQQAIGGSESENIESIRFNAPRYFQTQERAVTTSDYAILLQQKFPEINAVTVYGGEEANPPQYGRVFVAIDISNVEGIPDSKRDEYYNFLKTRSPLSIEPIFIEPSFLYYSIKSLVRYNINITTANRSFIQTSVINEIINYNEQNLDDFSSTLRYSRLISLIDNADPSIVSNSTEIEIYKKVPVILGKEQNLIIDFGIPLIDNLTAKQGTHPADDIHVIRTESFTSAGQVYTFGDDGDGILKLVKLDGNQHVFVKDIGTVDYSTGILKLDNFRIDSFNGSSFKVYALTKDKDITVSKNTIFTIEPDEINITVEAIRV
jgi:hypothetical protein